MKSLILSFLIMLGNVCSISAAPIGEGIYLCEGKDVSGKNISLKFEGWGDNRQNARADLTIDKEGVGPRTSVDLYVAGGDSDFSAFDFAVSDNFWSAEFYVYSSGHIDEEITVRFYESGKKIADLVCEEIE